MMSPKRVFALGLGVCGALNVAFGLSSSLPAFALFWFLNGCFQGLMAPACVKMITNWFSAEERGTWWAVWHASINLGGFIIPFLAGGLAETFGWRFGMIGPGAIASCTALLCLVVMKDSPAQSMAAPSQAARDALEPSAEAADAKPTEEAISLAQGIFMDPAQWALGAAYLLNYVVRQGLAVWGMFFLMHEGASSAAKAAALFSGFELGGFLGNLTAGALSDVFLRRAKPGQGLPGQRAKVVNIYFLAMLFLLPLLARCPSTLPTLQFLLLVALGHFICGVQLLLPLVAAERAPLRWLSTATGFIGWVGYFGAALAGLPLSFVVQRLGWGAYFGVLVTAAAFGTALMVPLCGLRSWRQRFDAPGAGAGR